MPSSRISSSRSTQKRVSTNGLARHIEQLGRASEMPCSNCHQHNRSCIVDRSKSLSCSECVRRKVSCDVSIDPDSRLDKEMEKSRQLEEEEEKLMREIATLQSRLIRTREQKRHSLRRQKEYFDRGMADLAEEMSGPSNDVVVEGSEESNWIQELNAMSPGSLERLAASVGQGSGDANPQSLS
ncbi:hypothetical protein B0T09DRAFT_332011 [Sordaria sp. MPI-SDFR-AT-0083]|nr:hypothetical protein B0T09DRAFT_332011 [Sordaria sp. MPI-SDFR-AT-0083]